MNGQQLPLIKTAIPGPHSRALARELQKLECPNITLFSDQGPIFWERAVGVNVWDADQNRYIDFTAGFGVAGTGHSNPRTVKSIRESSRRLIHHLGDVHPSKNKLLLMKNLRKILPKNLNTFFFGVSGSEAVEIALKTAFLASGKPGLIAFEGSYHGLSYGALRATALLNFRGPFKSQLDQNTEIVPLPAQSSENYSEKTVLDEIEKKVKKGNIGAILIEAVQGRGGIRIAPFSFMKKLRKLCTNHKIILIVDEIFSGFARTGKLFAFQHSGIAPDLVTLGKSLSGGFPISVCTGSRQIMSHWPRHKGEALHTSTFMSHPIGCAMAIASLQEIQKKHLTPKSQRDGKWMLRYLQNLLRPYPCVGDIRGLGLMIGIEILDPVNGAPDPARAHAIVTACLKNGLILLSDGIHKNILTLTPPLVISKKLIQEGVSILEKCIAMAQY